jgi:hypothetical protein
MLAELHAEREQVEEAILVLERIALGRGRRRGRPPKWMTGMKRRGRPPWEQEQTEGALEWLVGSRYQPRRSSVSTSPGVGRKLFAVVTVTLRLGETSEIRAD